MWRFLYLDCVLRFEDLGLNWSCHSWSMPYDATTFCTCGLRVQGSQWQEFHRLCHTKSLVFHCNVPWTPLEVLCYNEGECLHTSSAHNSWYPIITIHDNSFKWGGITDEMISSYAWAEVAQASQMAAKASCCNKDFYVYEYDHSVASAFIWICRD